MMSKLSLEEYENLKKFFICYVDWFIPINQKSTRLEDQPLEFLGRLEKTSMTNAKKGLQMAINDLVEMSSDWKPDQIATADQKFAQNQLPTLSEIRRRYSRKYLGLLKRGEIKTEQEYYLLKGIADGGSIEAGANEVGQIDVMLAAYERKLDKR
jgi:hypothetical protein